MSKKSGILLGLACFFAGMAIGFLVAPVKEGIGNNCGNNTHYHYHEPEEHKDKKDKKEKKEKKDK